MLETSNGTEPVDDPLTIDPPKKEDTSEARDSLGSPLALRKDDTADGRDSFADGRDSLGSPLMGKLLVDASTAFQDEAKKAKTGNEADGKKANNALKNQLSLDEPVEPSQNEAPEKSAPSLDDSEEKVKEKPDQFTNRRARILRSLGEHSIRRIRIPSHTITDGVTLYEVEVANKAFIWNLWLRFDSFVTLYTRLQELCTEYRQNDKERYKNLPPFPFKQPKMFVDHTNVQFIETRRRLLENFLQKILAHEDFRFFESFITFLLPPANEVAVAIPRKEPAPSSDDPTRSSKKKKKKRRYRFGVDMIDITDKDEITGVEVRKSQILKNDHTVFHIHCLNENKPKPYNQWTSLKRYGDFARFSATLRKQIQDRYPACMKFMPELPPKSSKLLQNHLDPVFIERRRLLLDVWCKGLLKYPVFRRHPTVLQFFQAGG